jgi:hypothetical protein
MLWMARRYPSTYWLRVRKRDREVFVVRICIIEKIFQWRALSVDFVSHALDDVQKHRNGNRRVFQVKIPKFLALSSFVERKVLFPKG